MIKYILLLLITTINNPVIKEVKVDRIEVNHYYYDNGIHNLLNRM